MLFHAAEPLAWSWEPSVVAGTVLISALYAALAGPLRRRFSWGEPVPASRQAAFHLANLCVFVALVSPLDSLADESLFSAHMIQHMLLTFVAPPLWLAGAPTWLAQKLVPIPALRRTLDRLTWPLSAFLIFNATMWAWHIPAAYNAALENERLHTIEHLAFMATAVIGWWPVLGPWLEEYPESESRLSTLGKAFYLFLSTFPCTGLAALITLTPTRLYTFYGNASLQWGLSPMLDQQLGGVFMWLPGDMIFMAVLLVCLAQWLNQAENVPT